jgi:hypothetical protein
MNTLKDGSHLYEVVYVLIYVQVLSQPRLDGKPG